MIGAQFGLIGLIPAMLNLTVVTGGQMMAVQICSGDGQAHAVQLPLGGSDPQDKQALCCAKGCHNGNSRKRVPAKIEPAQ